MPGVCTVIAMRDTRFLDVPRLLYAMVEVVRQVTGRPLVDTKPWKSDEAETVAATAKAAAALAELQVDIGRRHGQGLDPVVADRWRSAVRQLQAAAEELAPVAEALRQPGQQDLC